MGRRREAPLTIGRYDVERELGRGGMGVVYLAHDRSLGRLVAVKVLPDHLFRSSDSRERFFREARMAASLDHPHITPIYDAGEDEGRPYLAMRYVESQDLGALLLRDGAMDVSRACELVAQIGRALDAAHRHGIVHRDVKPANVLIATDPDGSDHGYLTDFGLARDVVRGAATDSGLLGTVGYMAPEQIRSSAVDGRADVYSLGCLLYQCLTGVPPFTGSEAAVMWAHVESPPPSVAAQREDLPVALDSVIARALAKDPADRFPTCADLAAELAAAIAEPYRAQRRVREVPTGGPAGLPAPAHRLIGRTRELAELGELLDDPTCRLVTLTGSGGIGKTRLAVEVARTRRERFPDGVWFVRLAPLADPELLTAFVATAIGLADAGQHLTAHLGEYLRERRALVVLDTFEHLLSAASDLSRLILDETRSTVLVTSRAPLHLSCEREYPLHALLTPAADGVLAVPELATNEAVALFVDRAASARPGFRLTTANAPAVAEVCELVDGLPLAIELAAARVRLLSPVDLCTRLTGSLEVLARTQRDAPERHRSLERTIGWSYELLDEQDQALLAELSVFAGAFTLTAAESVSTAATATFAGLERLADASLVQVAGGDEEPRFHLLRTVRIYADGRLAELGRRDATGVQHLRFYARLAAECGAALAGCDQLDALRRLAEDSDDIRSAVRFAIAHEEPSAVRIALSLAKYWDMTGAWTEGRRTIASVLEVSGVAPTDRATLLAWQALGAIRHGDVDDAASLSARAIEIVRECDDAGAHAFALQVRASVHYDLGEERAAAALQNEALALAVAAGDNVRRSLLLCDLANSVSSVGDLAEADSSACQGEALCALRGDGWGVTLITLNRSGIAIDVGSYDDACDQLDECRRRYGDILEASPTLGAQFCLNRGLARLGARMPAAAADDLMNGLRIAHQAGKRPYVVDAADALIVAFAESRPEVAARLDGFVAQQRDDHVLPPIEPLLAELRKTEMPPLVDRLGEQRFRGLQASGAASSTTELMAVVFASHVGVGGGLPSS